MGEWSYTWDLRNTKEFDPTTSRFAELPRGLYMAELTGVTKGESATKKAPRLEFQAKIVGGEYDGQKTRFDIYLDITKNPNAERMKAILANKGPAAENAMAQTPINVEDGKTFPVGMKVCIFVNPKPEGELIKEGKYAGKRPFPDVDPISPKMYETLKAQMAQGATATGTQAPAITAAPSANGTIANAANALGGAVSL